MLEEKFGLQFYIPINKCRKCTIYFTTFIQNWGRQGGAKF